VTGEGPDGPHKVDGSGAAPRKWATSAPPAARQGFPARCFPVGGNASCSTAAAAIICARPKGRRGRPPQRPPVDDRGSSPWRWQADAATRDVVSLQPAREALAAFRRRALRVEARPGAVQSGDSASTDQPLSPLLDGLQGDWITYGAAAWKADTPIYSPRLLRAPSTPRSPPQRGS